MSETITLPRAEYEKLVEREALLSQVPDFAPVLIWISGTDSLCTWFNKPWLDFRGRSLEQEAGNGWTEGVHKEDLDHCLGIYLSNFERRTPFHMEYRLLRADGDYRWLLDHGVPRFTEDGTFLGYIGSCIDITEIQEGRQVRLDLAKRASELAAIVDSSEDVIVSKNLDGIVTSWNAAATRVFGYTAEEMIGQSILKLIPEELYSDEQAILESIRAGRSIKHFETVRLAKDGRRLDVSLTVSPVKDDHGQVIGASKILRNISDRKRLEQSLIQAEKLAATGRMAATIAHEINNPLEAVMNLLYLVRPTVSGDDGIGYLDAAESELERVSHIAKQTLGYYREHTSAVRASLSDIAQHAITIYGPRCRAAGITIHSSLNSDRKLVIRRGEMMQVVSNLLANSIYAMPSGGTINIEISDVKADPQGVNIIIRDNGTGIAPDDLPRVFNAFFTTRATVGTGIGLFVAKQFIEGHGGKITIKSNQDGEAPGTTICIFLPLVTNYEML